MGERVGQPVDERQPGVHLDETGREQATRTAERLAAVPLAGIVTSPLERCRETAKALAEAQRERVRVTAERGLLECDYGEWEGRKLGQLSRLKLWRAVQRHPSGVTFPGGEAMAEMSARAVAAVRRHGARVETAAGPSAVWAAVTHGDLVKAILADALGLHLDQFQRIHVDPGSISIVRYTGTRPYVLASNTHAGDLSWLTPPRKGRRTRTSDDAPIGGGSGPAA